MGRRKHRRAHGEPLAAAPPPPSSGPPAPATPAPAARVPTERLDAVLGLLAAPDSGAASRDGSSTRTGARARPATDPGADWPPELRARYRPLEELGRGGSGVVVRVRDLQMGRDAALKLLQVSAFTDPDHLVRFRREVLATAGLRHPHVVTIYDVGEAGGRPYYTMEWIEGASLAELARRRSLAPREAVEIARQIAEALAAGHAAGIIHRDVKPHNILVREAPASSGAATWHAYVADFGLAKFVLRDAADAATLHRSVMSLTRENQVLGTPWYMSPEQVKGDPLDPRTDVYSLGATLYELLVGAPPLEAPTLAEQFRRIVHDDPVPPRRRNAEVDADLETIVLVCLQKNPAQRYPTAGALAEDCRRWLAGETPAARAVGPVRRLWRRARRNPSVAIPTALLAILLLGAPVVLGGSALLDAARTRRALVAGEAALAAGDWREAGRQAEAADGWAPGDAAAAALMALARADEQAEQGDGGFSRYRATAQRVDALIEERTRLAARLRQARTQAEMRPLWEIAGRIHEAEHECEIAFETAAARYSAALGFHPTHARANERLGDLYWACWVDARESGNVGERRAYEALILRHAPTKYGAALHATGGLEIDLLPGTAPRAVPLRAYLYRFEDAVVPPVSAPHPVVPATGAPAGGPAPPAPPPPAAPGGGGGAPGGGPARRPAGARRSFRRGSGSRRGRRRAAVRDQPPRGDLPPAHSSGTGRLAGADPDRRDARRIAAHRLSAGRRGGRAPVLRRRAAVGRGGAGMGADPRRGPRGCGVRLALRGHPRRLPRVSERPRLAVGGARADAASRGGGRRDRGGRRRRLPPDRRRACRRAGVRGVGRGGVGLRAPGDRAGGRGVGDPAAQERGVAARVSGGRRAALPVGQRVPSYFLSGARFPSGRSAPGGAGAGRAVSARRGAARGAGPRGRRSRVDFEPSGRRGGAAHRPRRRLVAARFPLRRGGGGRAGAGSAGREHRLPARGATIPLSSRVFPKGPRRCGIFSGTGVTRFGVEGRLP